MDETNANEHVEPAAQLGLFGLGVMGANLALNIVRRGFSLAAYDREPRLVAELIARAAGKSVRGAASIQEFARLLERPRRIVLLVKAGAPVDWTIEQLSPYLEPGDILVDGGNSHFKDTEHRQRELSSRGVRLIGSGVSGGAQGALMGPSLMPGGDREAYERIRPVWESIAAKTEDGPCVVYFGPGGAGHFVKMMHNAIEYADMQLIAEAYDLVRRLLGFDAGRLAEVFEEWNRGELESFLTETTSKVLRARDPETGRPLVDLILDQAGQKGTGRWAGEAALELGVAVPTISAALDARNLSALKDERLAASERLIGPSFADDLGAEEFVEAVRGALYASKICAYAQGTNLVRAGSRAYGWDIDLGETARVWQGGCIIRARLLADIRRAYAGRKDLPNLMLDPALSARLARAQDSWRSVVALAARAGVPAHAMSASLGYYDLYRAASLPLNLTQAQRDYFGAHTYERTDRPGVPIHTEWKTLC